jgi:predicted transcriptional regulator YdeE
MSSNAESREPRILDYGPQKLIGLGRVVKTSEDCKNVWADQHGFVARMGEAQPSGGQVPYFGICRCAAGAEPGAFEYIAAMPAAAGAPVPEGMAEFTLPAGTYAEFPVAGLADIGRVWGYTAEWLAAHPEWQGFCDGDPDGCGCVEHPAFELYPPGFDESGGLFIYVPLRPAE